MNGALVFFWILAALSVITALGVVLNKSPIRCALLLVINFVCLAVFYVLLNAQVLALFQILVYAGAIMVLFLFVIQLLNLGGESATSDPLVGQRFFGTVLGLGLFVGLTYALIRYIPNASTAGAERVRQAELANISQVQIIGWDLFTKYVYPFELTSILLLVGVIGVMIFTRHTGKAANQDG